MSAAAGFSLQLTAEFYSHDKLLLILGLEMIRAVVWGGENQTGFNAGKLRTRLLVFFSSGSRNRETEFKMW